MWAYRVVSVFLVKLRPDQPWEASYRSKWRKWSPRCWKLTRNFALENQNEFEYLCLQTSVHSPKLRTLNGMLCLNSVKCRTKSIKWYADRSTQHKTGKGFNFKRFQLINFAIKCKMFSHFWWSINEVTTEDKVKNVDAKFTVKFNAMILPQISQASNGWTLKLTEIVEICIEL